MTQQTSNRTLSELASLLGNLVEHSEGLLEQQLALLRSEVRHELGKAGTSAACAAAGAGCLAAGGLLSTVMLVHLLHRSSRLPLWACYGLVSGGMLAAGAGLLAQGRRSAANLELGLPQTTQALRENLTWLKEQITPAPEPAR